MDFPIDPSILSKPISELALPEDQRSEGVQIDAGAFTQETTEEGTGTSPASEEEGKVPYRRFKKFHDAALEAQREAEFWKNKAMEQQFPQRQESTGYEVPGSSVEPSYSGSDWERFKALFAGADESAVKEAYRLEVQRMAAIEDRAVRRAEEAIDRRTQSERQQFQQNIGILDQNLEEAADLIGRDLTSDEESALLDIQDEYAARDSDGNIIGLLSADKALQIYQMQQSRTQSPRREARNAVAALSGQSSGGDTSMSQSSQEKSANYVPGLGWRANLKRMTGRDIPN